MTDTWSVEAPRRSWTADLAIEANSETQPIATSSDAPPTAYPRNPPEAEEPCAPEPPAADRFRISKDSNEFGTPLDALTPVMASEP